MQLSINSLWLRKTAVNHGGIAIFMARPDWLAMFKARSGGEQKVLDY